MSKIILAGLSIVALLGATLFYLSPSKQITALAPVSSTTSTTFPTTTAPIKEAVRITPAAKPVTPAPATVATPKTTSTPVIPTTPKPEPAEKDDKEYKAYVTGYSYWDNTPPGSSDISNPVIHTKAGGTGTYQDPITVAVGHSIIDDEDILDYDEGTKFYFPHLRKYGIVEDTCGDGPSPQNGPCHTGYQGYPWLDIYVGGDEVPESVSEDCMNDITNIVTIIEDPGPNYPVVVGPLSESGCDTY